MPRHANLLLCVGAAALLGVVPWADAWTADDACCAKGTITQVVDGIATQPGFGTNGFYVPPLEIELGCSSPAVATAGAATTRNANTATMQFSLAPGEYDIEIKTTGCTGAAAGKPDENTTVQSGMCPGVKILKDGSTSGGECKIFLIDQETFEDIDSQYDMPPTISSIKSENIVIKRFPGANRSSAMADQHATITLEILDTGGFNSNEITGHHVVFDAGRDANNNEHVADWAPENAVYNPLTNGPDNILSAEGGGFTYAPCTRAFDGATPELHRNPGPFVCKLELWPTSEADGKNVFFSARVEELVKGVPAGRTSVVYGSVAVSNVQKDTFLIQATSKPKICDKFENVGTCSQDYPGSTGPRIINEGGADEELATATNPENITLGADQAVSPLRVPLIYPSVPKIYNAGDPVRKFGNDPLPSWLESYVVMEAYIWDEDLGFPASEDKVGLEITVTDRTEWVGLTTGNDTDQRGDQILPGCGKIIPFLDQSVEDAKTTFHGKSASSPFMLNIAKEKGDEGALDIATGTGTNREKNTVRRVQWLWQPFGDTGFLGKTYKKANGEEGTVVTTADPNDFQHAFGQSRCEFNFKALDNSAAYVVKDGDDYQDQPSNIVRRTYIVGTEKDSLTTQLSEPLPMIYGSYVNDLSPMVASGAYDAATNTFANPSVVPATISFGKDTRCRQAVYATNGTLVNAPHVTHDPTANRSMMTTEEKLYHDYCEDVEGGFEVFVELLTQSASTGYTYAGSNMARMMITGSEIFGDADKVVCKEYTGAAVALDDWPDDEDTQSEGRTANGCRIKLRKPGDYGNAWVLKLSITVKTLGVGEEFLLRMTTRNLQNNNFGQRPKFEEVWDFSTVTTTGGSTQSFLFGNGNRRSRSRRGLREQNVAPTFALALGDSSVKRARKRREVTTSGGVKWDDKGVGAFSFVPPSFYSGKAGTKPKVSTASLGTLDRQELMQETVAVCNAMLMNATSTDQTEINKKIIEQTDKIAGMYDGLFNDFELASSDEKKALNALADAVVEISKNGDNEDARKAMDDQIVELRTMIVADKKQSNAGQMFNARLAADTKDGMKTLNLGVANDTSLLLAIAQRQADAGNKLTLLMLSVLEAGQHDDKHQDLALDPEPVQPGKWSSSAAGWSQIWVLTLVTIMFLYGSLVVFIEKMDMWNSRDGGQRSGEAMYSGLRH